MSQSEQKETREEYLQRLRDEYLEGQRQDGPQTKEEKQEMEEKKELFQLINEAVGSYCEIKTMNNRLIVLGRLTELKYVAVSIVSADESPMPPVLFNTEVKLVLRPPKQPPLVLRASVRGSSSELWKLDRLERFHFKDARSYFRQPVSVPANVRKIMDPATPEEELLSVNPEGLVQDDLQELPLCTVLDVSLEGIRVRSTELFERGDWIELSNLYLTTEDSVPFVLAGQICWADKVSREEHMYGCRFLSMSEAEQDTLCASIFTLQRQELQARRLQR